MDVLTSKTVTTRKPHRCFGCATSYPKKTQMAYMVAVDQGTFHASYLCMTCEAVVREDWDEADTFSMGEVKGNDEERWLEVQARLSKQPIPS